MLSLRPYQERSLNSLRHSFKSGNKAVMLYLSTGGGKTECAISIMDATAKAGNRAAMILDRRVLVHQTSERLDKYGIPHGVIMADTLRFRPEEKIQICSAQTLEKCETYPEVDLLIIDEAHNTRKSVTDFIKNTRIRTIGLSATPFTKGLGNIYSDVVSEVTTSELVDSGSLVPLKVFISKEIDMEGAKKVAGEWAQNEVTARGVQITGDIVTEWVKKTYEIFGKPEKTIVFGAGIAHGADLQDKFSRAGYNFIAISADDDDQFKTEVIEEFKRPNSSIHGLISTDILTKGFDVPDVMIGISARPFSKSLSSHIQQMGRIMRPCFGKTFGVWLDHSGNYLRFKADWEDIYFNGVDRLEEGKEKAKKEPTREEKEAAKCPKCSHLWPSKSDVCANCGFTRQKKNAVEVKPGELIELGDTFKKQVEEQRNFYHQLLFIETQRQYKTGWAFCKFKEKFGAYPKIETGLAEPTLATLGWVKSRQIAFAKMSKKVGARR